MRLIKQLFREPGRFRYDPYVIAEIGMNYEGDMTLAKLLIDQAKAGGADAVKFQTYKAETLAQKDSPAYWDTSLESATSQFALFKRYDSFWVDEYRELKRHCDKVGVEFMSTPFDSESVGFLSELVPAFKISSSDLTNRLLIEDVVSTGLPIILSTGCSSLAEIEEARRWIGDRPLCLLHCVLNYPTKDDDANLDMITGLQDEFPDVPIGYSDHTLPGDMTNLVTSALLGAVVVEKHFTHDKSLPGNDHYHAMNSSDLLNYKNKIERLKITLGRREKVALENENISVRYARRSLVASRDLPAGHIIEKNDFIAKRPGNGISPSDYKSVLGRKLKTSLICDEAFQWEYLDGPVT